MKRNGKIDVLRFMFSIAILLLHSSNFHPEGAVFSRAGLGVDFFFILSGFLMAASIQQKEAYGPASDLGKETQQYLTKKTLGFLPEYLISLVIGFFYMELKWHDLGPVALVKRLALCIWEPMFLGMAGFGDMRINSVDWYLSAMLLAMLILYPLCRRYFSMSKCVIMPVIAIFIYGYFYRVYGTTVTVYETIGFVFTGIARAFAGIALGVGLYPQIIKMRNANLSHKKKLILTIVEPSIYVMVFSYMHLYKQDNWDFFCLLLIVAGFCVTCMHQGIWDHLFDSKICYALGKFSLLIYLSHNYVSHALTAQFPGYPYKKLFIIYVALSLANAMIIHFTAQNLRNRFSLLNGRPQE